MSYSRFINSPWYTYPSEVDGKNVIVCIRGNGFDTYFWEAGQTYEDFIAETAASMLHDDFYEADLQELKDILQRNMEDIKKELSSEPQQPQA